MEVKDGGNLGGLINLIPLMHAESVLEPSGFPINLPVVCCALAWLQWGIKRTAITLHRQFLKLPLKKQSCNAY
jgi:hypothetical protein